MFQIIHVIFYTLYLIRFLLLKSVIFYHKSIYNNLTTFEFNSKISEENKKTTLFRAYFFINNII